MMKWLKWTTFLLVSFLLLGCGRPMIISPADNTPYEIEANGQSAGVARELIRVQLDSYGGGSTVEFRHSVPSDMMTCYNGSDTIPGICYTYGQASRQDSQACSTTPCPVVILLRQGDQIIDVRFVTVQLRQGY